MNPDHRNRKRPLRALPAAALAVLTGLGVAAASLVPAEPPSAPELRNASDDVVSAVGEAAECGAGSYDAEAELDGSTWTVRNGGDVVHEGPDMLTAMRAAVDSIDPGRTSQESVVVRGSGTVPADASLDLPSHTSFEACGVIDVTGTVSADNAAVRIRHVQDVSVPHLSLSGSPYFGVFVQSAQDVRFGQVDLSMSGGHGMRIDSRDDDEVRQARDMVAVLVCDENGVDALELFAGGEQTAGDFLRRLRVDRDFEEPGRALNDLAELVGCVEIQPVEHPEPVPQRRGEQARSGRRAHEGKARQVELDGARAGPLADDDVELKVFHGGIEDLLYDPVQAMDLVDEQHVARLKVREDRREVARAPVEERGRDEDDGEQDEVAGGGQDARENDRRLAGHHREDDVERGDPEEERVRPRRARDVVGEGLQQLASTSGRRAFARQIRIRVELHARRSSFSTRMRARGPFAVPLVLSWARSPASFASAAPEC